MIVYRKLINICTSRRRKRKLWLVFEAWSALLRGFFLKIDISREFLFLQKKIRHLLGMFCFDHARSCIFFTLLKKFETKTTKNCF